MHELRHKTYLFKMAMFEGSFKWFLGSRPLFGEELQELEASTSEQNWIPRLSSTANAVVHRCSIILETSAFALQKCFDSEASESLKNSQTYARNFLEYCCFSALSRPTHMLSNLSDKKFRRMMFLMMIAWEVPSADSSKQLLDVDDDATVGIESFSRIAPAVPLIADVVIAYYLFEVLTSATGGRLPFYAFEKYLTALERAIKKLKSQTESSLLSTPRRSRAEKILDVDGTITTQPVLQHIGMSAWPGRLTLTDHAFYFESLQVVTYEKAKRYDLSEDTKQLIKPDLIGPLGARLFDRAVVYRSTSLAEAARFEFPELMGHTRRDYWLSIVQEILYAHRFVRKFNVTGPDRDDALAKAALGVSRLQAVQDAVSSSQIDHRSLLTFTACHTLPSGDLILEAMAAARPPPATLFRSMSASAFASSIGLLPATSPLVVGELTVGSDTPLDRAVRCSRTSHRHVALAQATVDGVRLEGIDVNLAVMQELLSPVINLGRCVYRLAEWEDPVWSAAFCITGCLVICRAWAGRCAAAALASASAFVLMAWMVGGGRAEGMTVAAPAVSSRVDQLLALQTAVSRFEESLREANVVLLKVRALLLSLFPRASVPFSVALLVLAAMIAVLPPRLIALAAFLELFTRRSAPRRASTERWMRRLRDWWVTIPAPPLVIERGKEGKKSS